MAGSLMWFCGGLTLGGVGVMMDWYQDGLAS
jgi:hypothetical protein